MLDGVPPVYAPGCINFLNQNFGVIAYNYKIKFTTNGGTSWDNSVVNDFASDTWFNDVKMVNATTGYALAHRKYSSVDHKAIIYKTTNACETWNRLTFSFENTDNYNIKFGFSFVSEQGAWVCGMTRNNPPLSEESYCINTSNGFTNYTALGIGGNKEIHNCYFINQNTGWLIGERGIYKTSNTGYSFVPQTGDEYLNDIQFLNEHTGWVVGDTGKIFKTTSGGEPIGIQTISTQVPNSYQLSQNYPNPFNPSTVITFDIVKTGKVTLRIFDVLGRTIETLCNQTLTPGAYSVNWIASGYPSGVYFYRLETDEFIKTKKMILTK